MLLPLCLDHDIPSVLFTKRAHLNNHPGQVLALFFVVTVARTGEASHLTLLCETVVSQINMLDRLCWWISC